MSDNVIGRCQHCNVAQFDNPNADAALDAMAHLCWKCVRPHGLIIPGMRVRHVATESRPRPPIFATVMRREGDNAVVQWDEHDGYDTLPAERLESVR